MTTLERNLIWLDCFDFLSYNKKAKILKLYDEAEDIIENFEREKVQLSKLITEKEFNVMNSQRDISKLDDWIKGYNNRGIEIITLYSFNYPELLKDVENPPFVLYCMGNLQLLNTTCCAVVGTRRPSEYGMVTTRQFVKELSQAGVTIVSGLALGVDTIARETAISEKGSTIAVIAGGFDHIYPASNKSLFQVMLQDNLVITESKPSVFPQAFMFPVRNRIIAGLSRAVLITEAGKKSGALHTKNYAVEANREVFALPGRINSIESEGTNAIIKQCQSCLCLNPSEIIESLGVITKNNFKKPAFQLDITEQTILNYILAEKKCYQEILDYTKLSSRELNTVLFNMQIKGYIEKLAGNNYIALIKP